jgi:hypothetical protein
MVDSGPNGDTTDDDSAGYSPADHDRLRSVGPISNGPTSNGPTSDGTNPDGHTPDGTIPDGTIPDGNGDDEAPWRTDDRTEGPDGRTDPMRETADRPTARRADGGAPETGRPPAAAAAVPDAEAIGRPPDVTTDQADAATDRPDAGVLAKLRDVL